MILGARHVLVELSQPIEGIPANEETVYFRDLCFCAGKLNIADLFALVPEMAVGQAALIFRAIEEGIHVVGKIAAGLVNFRMKGRALADQGLDHFGAGFLGAPSVVESRAVGDDAVVVVDCSPMKLTMAVLWLAWFLEARAQCLCG